MRLTETADCPACACRVQARFALAPSRRARSLICPQCGHAWSQRAESESTV